MTTEIFGQPTERHIQLFDNKKTKFVDLGSTATIRILSLDRVSVQTHFLNKSTVKCLGDNCPICRNNKILIMQYPDTFRDEPFYSPVRTVKLVNVLDKTLVKKCSKCSTENRSGDTNCRSCSEILTEAPIPSMQVKVLSRGVTLFDQLDAIHNALKDNQGNLIGITNYDITLVVSGSGRSKTITPMSSQISDSPEINQDDLYNLDNITITLTDVEMIDLQRGVSLRDIFAARKAQSEVKDVNVISDELMQEVKGDVDKLFGTS